MLFLLLLLALVAVGYAVAHDQQGLMSGAALLIAVVSLSFRGIWRWAALLVYPLAFLASLALPGKEPPTVEMLVGGLLTIVALAWLLLRDQSQQQELEWRRKVVDALRTGSERLNEARNDEAIIRAGLNILVKLQVAPNLAFVAYRQGTPYVMAAQGAFNTFLNKPVYPSDNDSRSVQADHWVAEEVLALLSRAERQSYLVAEVYGRDSTHLGLLILARPTPQPFSAEERGVVQSFARLLGAQLGQERANRNLREANDLTLRSLGAALERRDDETGGHTARVVGLATRLAQRLGWDEEQVRALRWGAYLHDLGKIAIPDRILHKNGALDDQEKQVIRSHTTVGYEMLQDLHFLPAETLDLVRYHHERWDGTGYPSGLRGDNIPDAARIFSIVDVYDALTSERPYKSAWSPERALQEIRAGAGAHFDPQYVEAFLYLMAEQDDARLVH
ncbi:HD-GYP domain-containing protein [Deinococcus radiodurans]